MFIGPHGPSSCGSRRMPSASGPADGLFPSFPGVALPDPWMRRGRLISPEDLPGSYRLVQVPACWELAGGMVRISFTARDAANRGYVFTLDADPHEAMRIVRLDRTPILGPERVEGSQGVGISTVLDDGDGRLCAYGGALRLTPPNYDISVVTMTSEDGGRSFSDPRVVLSAEQNNGLPVVSGCVRREGPTWRMWYAAFESWRPIADNPPDSRYSIRHATSPDGLTWTLDTGVALARRSEAEAGIISPTVLKSVTGYEMWCSRRGPFDDRNALLRRYRLIRATSPDGHRFTADDAAQVFANPPLPGDWDCEMQCYPHIVAGKGRADMLLYCGNGYGAAGIGWASRPAAPICSS